MFRQTSIALVLVALAASGCSRSSNALSGVSTQSPPQALPSVPSGSVQSTQLDPLGQPQPYDPNQPVDPNNPNALADGTSAPEVPGNGTEVAGLNPQGAEQEPLKHEPLAGAWNVSSDNAGCRAILSFTQWSGGYRATTLRCNSPELSSVTAWDIKGSQVVLIDSNGAQVASLGRAGNERYAGRTSAGQPVTFSR